MSSIYTGHDVCPFASRFPGPPGADGPPLHAGAPILPPSHPGPDRSALGARRGPSAAPKATGQGVLARADLFPLPDVLVLDLADPPRQHLLPRSRSAGAGAFLPVPRR